MKKPPFTARELIERKKTAAEKLRRETEEALGAAKPRVRSEYQRCTKKIKAVPKHPLNTHGVSCETVIYKSLNGRLTRTEITLIHDLLQKQGWDVRLATTLDKKKGPKPIELIYHHHHGRA
ncbi:MAG: hypothetical protein QY323_03485 [Patescibacteria group bacterium]|nr:MAG: hypothetical protein QY323_03485 [Patescibacteria group bacterium]